jgi:hypothetical protein
MDACAAVAEEHADIYRDTLDCAQTIACATFDAADAEYVVALVNAHEAMAEELREARDYAEQLKRRIERGNAERDTIRDETIDECAAVCDRQAPGYCAAAIRALKGAT